jgi:hypothetical protein
MTRQFIITYSKGQKQNKGGRKNKEYILNKSEKLTIRIKKRERSNKIAYIAIIGLLYKRIIYG